MMHSNLAQTEKQINSRLISILIVDDQKVVRARLQEIFDDRQNIKVVGMVDDGDKAIAAVASLNPDLVLIDIEMPKMNGIEVTRVICQRFPATKVLVLSTHEKEEYVRQVIAAGADGYIIKHTSAADLVSAVHAVSRGCSHFGPQILKKVRLSERSLQPVKEDLALTPTPSNSLQATKISRQNDSNLANIASVRTEEFLPPIGKWLRWGGISVITTIALVVPSTAVLKYKTTVKTPATVRPEGEVRIVQTAVEGQITEITVKQGQTVDRGEVIAIVDPARFEIQRNQLTGAIAQQKLQLKQIEAQIASLNGQTIAETERNNSEISAAESELAGNLRNHQVQNVEADTQADEAQAKLKAVEAALNAAITKRNRYRAAAQAGAIGKDRLAEVELEVRQQQQELNIAQASLQRSVAALNPSTATVEMARERIEVKKSGRATVAGLEQEREALVRQRIELNKQLEQDLETLRQVNLDLGKTKITATAVGTISELKLRNSGQTVQAGEIAQIVPNSTPLEIKATVSPQDIGKLEVDQKVQMRISTPYPDYGTLHGTVSRIASDVSSVRRDPDDSSDARSPAAFFAVSISPVDTSFGRGENICSLQAGMEGTADIITREETVLQFLLRKARLIGNI